VEHEQRPPSCIAAKQDRISKQQKAEKRNPTADQEEQRRPLILQTPSSTPAMGKRESQRHHSDPTQDKLI